MVAASVASVMPKKRERLSLLVNDDMSFSTGVGWLVQLFPRCI
jgi:hypothetical protein